MRALTLQASLNAQLDPSSWQGRGVSPTNFLIGILIVIASIVAVLETEVTLRSMAPDFFVVFELTIVTIFSVEYLCRLYAAGADPRYRGVSGRFRYIISIWSIIDLLAILPVLLMPLTSSPFLIRTLRLIKLFRLARLGRFSLAANAIAEAISRRKFELLVSLAIAGVLLLLSSALLYLVEANHQPEAFGSIPRALWWSVATLTTVGYGDVAPITPLGKLLAGITAIVGIGMIAMPTGILASAFSDALQNDRKNNQ